jgi:hypothetical protein
MNPPCHWPKKLVSGLALGLAAVSWHSTVFNPVLAQQMQTRLPAFQAPASDSLETELLGRLSVTGEYQSGDLMRLARLSVLESIATLVNIHVDLQGSPIGFRLEEQAAALVDASEFFYETVGFSPLDVNTMSRAQSDFDDVGAAYTQLEGTLGPLPGFSSRAAGHLQAVTQLMNASDAVMGAIESDIASTIPVPVERPIDTEAMRSQAQLLANAIVDLIGKVSDSKQGDVRANGVLEDLSAMLVRSREFARSLALPNSFKELEQSFRATRRAMWRVEAEINQLAWPADLRNRWRDVREQANAISDGFGLPRVIAASEPRQILASATGETNRIQRPLPRVIRPGHAADALGREPGPSRPRSFVSSPRGRR